MAESAARSTDDEDLVFHIEIRIRGIDRAVDITTYALGELEWGGVCIRIGVGRHFGKTQRLEAVRVGTVCLSE